MSRHLRRVGLRRLEEDIAGEPGQESEDDSEEEAPAPVTFVSLQESSDESSDSSEVEDSSNLEGVLQRARDAERNEAAGEENEEELDELLEKLAAGGVGDSSSAPRDAVDGPLSVDVPKLNSAAEMRQRFGAQSLQPAEAGGGGQVRRRWGGGRRTPATLLQRRLLFGAYSEEWPRPPSFVGGGIGMDRRERADGLEEFTFKYSDAYRALNESYQGILQSHDPNSLALFVGTNGDTHAQALLQLAMICAHTAQSEKAAEFVRRSLSVFEAAQLEAFRPAMSQGIARIPYEEEANRPFFNALFRHAQLTHMAGCSGTAMEVTKLLLQLDPTSDPTCSWLVFDVYALASRDKQGLAALNRLYRDPFCLEPPVRKPPRADQEHVAGHESSEGRPCDVDENTDNSGAAHSEVSERSREAEASRATTSDLINIAFSTSLALWLSDLKADAVRAAAQALCKFPFMLKRLLGSMEVHTAGRRSRTNMTAGMREALGPVAEVGEYVDWPSILESKFFGDAEMRWNSLSADGVFPQLTPITAPVGRVPSELANKISTLYIGRLGSVWKDLVEYQSSDDLLLFAAGRVSHLSQLRETDNAGEIDPMNPWRIEDVARSTYSSIASGISRYRAFVPEDFADAFPRLPNEMALMNPELLHAGVARAIVRQRRQQIVPNVDDAQLAAMMNLQGFDGLQPGDGVPLDLNRPLAQLLWQSLLPWNTLAR